MFKAFIKGAIVGGIVFFIWSAISWMVIPWHKATINRFRNEAEVISVVKRNAPKDGVYMFPHHDMEKHVRPNQDDPCIFMSYKKEGAKMGVMNFVWGILTQVLAAGIISIMLMMTKTTYFGRLIFVTLGGFFAGVSCFLPSMNWMGFPGDYVLVGILDLIIGWFIAGLFLAALVNPCKCCHSTDQSNPPPPAQ